MSGLKRCAWVAIAAVAVVSIVVGLDRGEFIGVRQMANTLCTACIGLTAGH